MKISKNRFVVLKKSVQLSNSKLIHLYDNKYIISMSPKNRVKQFFKMLFHIAVLPLGLIICLWDGGIKEYLESLPSAFQDVWCSLVDSLFVTIVTVEDEYKGNVVKANFKSME